MSQLLAAVQQVIVPGDLGHCWSYISDPPLVSQWFADTDQIRLKEPVHFTFGDGDFFDATVVEYEAPTFIRFLWKFMGVGTPSDVSLFLCPLDGKTEITVLDRGEYTTRAVGELRDGWRDFLSRLERKITTGENSRYRWCMGDGDGPDISMEAVVQCDKVSIVRTLRQVSWWRDAFPHSNPVLLMPDGVDEFVRVVFQEADWSGKQTKATIEIEVRRDGLGILVRHTGWTGLSRDVQLDARKRWAALWQDALLKLEHQFAIKGGCYSMSSEDHLFANTKL